MRTALRDDSLPALAPVSLASARVGLCRTPWRGRAGRDAQALLDDAAAAIARDARGLPLGVQLVARRYGDARLLDFAHTGLATLAWADADAALPRGVRIGNHGGTDMTREDR